MRIMISWRPAVVSAETKRSPEGDQETEDKIAPEERSGRTAPESIVSSSTRDVRCPSVQRRRLADSDRQPGLIRSICCFATHLRWTGTVISRTRSHACEPHCNVQGARHAIQHRLWLTRSKQARKRTSRPQTRAKEGKTPRFDENSHTGLRHCFSERAWR